ncbi:nonstructural protein S [Ntepes virus]|uniref:Nucleoprotein n=1 Tax=Ntepes virus TaxID=2569589 RepID=A0A499RYQ3_9VIRU|nr:nonstructural protein S [Ntepes virus]AYC35225.1 nonstructural protein S [Ntepes virus]QNJ99621.1 nonstructural protein [Ntepes virus]
MSDYAQIAIEFGSSGIDRDLIEAWVREFEYQGFDPKVVVKIVTETGEGWQNDVKKMIILALTRGNKPEKMIAKMSAKGREEVTRLVKKYKLKSGNPGRNDLTLSRVAAAFASWTCAAIYYVQDYLPVTGSHMDAISRNYPRAMMHPSFAGLIDPGMRDREILVEAHSLFLIEFAQKINVNLRGKSKAEILLSFDQPLNAAINSNFLTSSQKLKALAALGVIDEHQKPNRDVVSAADAFRKM